MPKTKQIASIQYRGFRILIVQHFDKKPNPFHILKLWHESGCRYERRITITKYSDLHSCWFHLLTLPNLE